MMYIACIYNKGLLINTAEKMKMSRRKRWCAVLAQRLIVRKDEKNTTFPSLNFNVLTEVRIFLKFPETSFQIVKENWSVGCQI